MLGVVEYEQAAYVDYSGMTFTIYERGGDALMAYFGGRTQDRESTSMAAINCAAMLRLLMAESIVPSLKEKGVQLEDLGFRVGIDFGDDGEVLWSSYGYSDVSEVTATSLYVDAAAKLQSMASHNNAMMGNNLVEYLDFPNTFTEDKKDEATEEIVRYLAPNYLLSDGRQHNYRIRELKFDEFVKLMPIPLNLRHGMIPGARALDGVSFVAFVKDGDRYVPYRSMSYCVDKETEVLFRINVEPYAMNGLRLPLRGKFIRKNHGKEAADAGHGDDDIGEFDLKPRVNAIRTQEPIFHEWDREAKYRGVHTMEVQIFDANKQLVFADIIGVHIR